MNWRTEVQNKDFPGKELLSFSGKTLMMGSCFSDNIGRKLLAHKFDCLNNPLGISYNPYSIRKHISYLSDPSSVKREDFISSPKGMVHLDFHGQFAANLPTQSLRQIREALHQTIDFLHQTDTIFITYGTAYVYQHNTRGIVNNCHKLEVDLFERKLLTFDKVKTIIHETIRELKLIKPQIEIVFTISPVRHVKDGIVNDRRSKSILIAAVQESIQNEKSVHYFPSYEILTDDLRDYRFYKEDLIHPNEQGIKYIWQNVQQYLMSPPTRELLTKVNKVLNELNHKPLEESSNAYYKFLQNLSAKLVKLEKEGLDVTKEKKEIEQKIQFLNQ